MMRLAPLSLVQSHLLLVLLHIGSASTTSSYAALGDSYAAGTGPGAYPVLIADALGLDSPHGFRDLAAGGASTESVLHSQLPWIGSAELVTLTIGGNQVDFFGLVNECVYQWRPLSTCDKGIEKARALVEDSKFMKSFDYLIETAVAKLAADSQLLVTGYATFFNEETDQCDQASFSKTDPTAFMTKGRRRQLNKMLRMLNDVIIAATAARGGVYVDIDGLFEGHRFCEADIIEPDPDAPSSWFYGLKYRDYNEEGPSRDQAILISPLGEFVNLTRVFHPKPVGHQVIADELLRISGGNA